MLAVALAIALGGVERAPGASTRILFGSCNRVEYPQPLWPHVLARAPDAWVWAGDNVYGDTVTPDWTRPGGLRTEPATAERLRALYAAQKAVPGYAALLRSNATILGTWVRARAARRRAPPRRRAAPRRAHARRAPRCRVAGRP
jgi:alkaline phosphatase D